MRIPKNGNPFWLLILILLLITMILVCGCINPPSLNTTINSGNNNNSQIKTLTSENLQMSVKSGNVTITINTTTPEVHSSVHLYKGILRSNDSITHDFQPLAKERNNVTSEIDAPDIAKRILDGYGGLPPDAVLTQNKTSYLETYNHKTNTVESRRPVLTSVTFDRLINGYPVLGESDVIMLELGENDELLRIKKVWRTLENTNSDASLIPAHKAAEKLQRGEIINHRQVWEDVFIGDCEFAYYERSNVEPEITIEPIWVFSGRTRSGSWESYYVYARQSANITSAFPAPTV